MQYRSYQHVAKVELVDARTITCAYIDHPHFSHQCGLSSVLHCIDVRKVDTIARHKDVVNHFKGTMQTWVHFFRVRSGTTRQLHPILDTSEYATAASGQGLHQNKWS